MSMWRALILSGLLVACNEATPVNTVVGERDLSAHIPEADRARIGSEEHHHRFSLGETGAEVELLLTTGTDAETGAAWVRSARFEVVANDGQTISPPGVSGPLNTGTAEKPVASYSFQISFYEERIGKTVSGTAAGRFSGDGSFQLD